MRLQLDAKELRHILSIAGLPVSRQSVPILQCVHLSAKDGWLVAASSNLDIFTRARCEASVSDPGECCTNYDDLKAVATRLRGNVKLELSKEGLVISVEGVRLVLPISSEEFPSFSAPKEEVEIIDGVAAMAACVPFAATEETRYNLRGVTFDSDHAVGTDGKQFYCTTSSGGKGQIVPSDAAPAIAKIGGRLFLSNTTWRVEAENTHAAGRLVDANPVDWQRVLIHDEPFTELFADDLISAVEMATTGRADWVICEGRKGKYVVSGDRFKGLHIESAVDAPCEGEPQSFVTSTRILRSALKPFAGRKVSIASDGERIRVQPTQGGDFAIFMSMRDTRSNLREAA